MCKKESMCFVILIIWLWAKCIMLEYNKYYKFGWFLMGCIVRDENIMKKKKEEMKKAGDLRQIVSFFSWIAIIMFKNTAIVGREYQL